MITASPGFTAIFDAGTANLTSREQLFPGYPVASTQGYVVTPEQMHATGMAGLPPDLMKSLVAFVVILGVLYWISRDRGR